jgi:hypothetical protein
MIKCPYCHANNADTALFCGECGTYLLAEERKFTGMLGASGTQAEPFLQRQEQEGGPIRLRLQLPHLDHVLEFKLMPRQQLVIGRSDPATGAFPEIDLSAAEAFEKGVSRRHARIAERDGSLIIEDLGSVNGTSVNDKRLPPYLPAKLKEGDAVHIGQVVIRISIDRPPITSQE